MSAGSSYRGPSRTHYVIFTLMLSSTILGSLLQTSLSTILPSIMADFMITAVQAQWLTTAYSLTMGIIIPASAFLLQRFPTKKLYIASLLATTIGLVMCSIANSYSVLLAGRVFQAVGAGLSMSMLQVVILTIFPQHQQGTAMGVYGIACSVAPAFAPTLAGIISEYFHWRVMFQGASILYAVLLVLACKFMKDVLETEAVAFDLLSFILCSISFTGITMGIGSIMNRSLMDPVVLIPLLAGGLSMMVFVRRQLHMDAPFLNVRVLRDHACCTATIISMILYAVLIAGSTLVPMYLQILRGLSPSVSGLTMMPGSLTMAVISLVVGRLYNRLGIQRIAPTGAIIMLISCVGYCFADTATSILILIILFILRNAAVGCTMMPMVTWGMSHLPKDQKPHGTAILTSLRTIAGALGTAVFVGIMSSFSGESDISMTGIRISFICMTAISFIQLALTVKHVFASERMM